jgi:hypothetical protein
MPLRTARNNDLAFDRRLAALASRREEFVEIKMAEEAWGFVRAVVVLEARHVVDGGVRREEGDVGAGKAGTDPVDTFGVLVGGLRIEGYAFEMLAALVAGEAFRMKA